MLYMRWYLRVGFVAEHMCCTTVRVRVAGVSVSVWPKLWLLAESLLPVTRECQCICALVL
jgi:hypothetical protein